MNKPTPLLALDLGTTTGWACRDEFGKVTSGRETFSRRSGEGLGMRVLRFRSWLRGMLVAVRPAAVFYEQPIVHRKNKTGRSIGFQFEGAMLPELEEREITYTQPMPAEIKKHATGNGNAKKKQMICAAIDRWPHYSGPPDADDWKNGDDEADALAVLSLALAELKES